MTVSRDTYTPADHYRRVQFHQDRLVLDSELNELQDLLAEQCSALGALSLPDGKIVSGVLCSWSSGLVFAISAGLIALDGEIIPVTAGSVTFTTAPAAVWIEVLLQGITGDDDPDLLDPNTDEPVAERIQVLATPKNHDTSGDALPAGALSRRTVKIYDVDLTTLWGTPAVSNESDVLVNPAQDAIEAELVSLASGDFLVCGLDVAAYASTGRAADVTVAPGVCWIDGHRVVLGGVQTLEDVSFESVDDLYVCVLAGGVVAAQAAPSGLLLGKLHWPDTESQPWFLVADNRACDAVTRQRFWRESLLSAADRNLRSVAALKGSSVIVATPALTDVDLAESIVTVGARDEQGFALNQNAPAFQSRLADDGEIIAIDTQPVFRANVAVHDHATTLAYTEETDVLSSGTAHLPVPAGATAPALTTIEARIQIDTGSTPVWFDNSGYNRPCLKVADHQQPGLSPRMLDWLALDGRFAPRVGGYSLAQTFSLADDHVITSLTLCFTAKPSSGNVLVQLRPVVDGQPDSSVLAECLFAAADVTAGQSLEVAFGDPVFLQGGGHYAVTLCCNASGWVVATGSEVIGTLSIVQSGQAVELAGGSLALSLNWAVFAESGYVAFGALTTADVERMFTAVLGCPAGTTAVLERRVDLGGSYDWVAVELGSWAATAPANMFRVRMATENTRVSPALAHDCLLASIGPRQGRIVANSLTLGSAGSSVTVWVECREDDVLTVVPEGPVSTTAATLQDSLDLGDGWVQRRYTKTFPGPSTGPYVLAVDFSCALRSIVAAYI